MKYIFTLITLLLVLTGFTQDFPSPMSPKRMVNDFSGMFSSQELNALEQKLRNFNDTSSTQIAIVTVPTLHGYAPNDYAQRLAEQWGIGQKGKDNGILLLVKPKSREEKGQVAIAVGYGLEGVVPDAIASRIIRNEVIPEFQQGRFYAGVDKATGVLIKLTGGEYTADQYAKKGGGSNSSWPLVIPFLIIFLLPLFVKRHKGYTTGSSHGGAVPPFFIGGLGGGSGRNYGSFSSGGGSFGGFGGGGFGGGGASGSW